MIYHILPEAEAFSEHNGGATSRWAANVLRHDSNGTVVCSNADGSWGIGDHRVVTIVAYRLYLWALRASGGRIPWRLRQFACRLIFARFCAALNRHDVVYIHNRPELVSVFRTLLVTKHVGLVLHLHNSHLITYPEKVVTRATADLTLFCSRFLEDEARSRFPGLVPTAVIANGADRKLFFPADRMEKRTSDVDLPIILFVGRLVPEKGVHVFISAMRLLADRGVRAVAHIVGSAEFGRDATSGYIRALREDAPPNVQFLPYTSGRSLAQEYRRAAIFCCPSVWNEAFGMVNVEAMASRLPVVATRVGGIVDVFSSGGAVLVSPDSPVELAEAIAMLVSDASLRDRLASEGYESYLHRFEWEKIRSRYTNLIERFFDGADHSHTAG